VLIPGTGFGERRLPLAAIFQGISMKAKDLASAGLTPSHRAFTRDSYQVKAEEMAGFASAATDPFIKQQFIELSVGYWKLAGRPRPGV
jgi:hypothetical protein